jgi:thiamine biosynthesis lipoprotein
MTSADRHTARNSWSTVLAAVLLVFAGGCGHRPADQAVLTGETMGTTYTVKVVAPLDDTALKSIAAAVQSELDAVNDAMSTYRPESELSRLNASEGDAVFPLSERTRDVFRIALDVFEQTGGAFDVTVGPLVNAWGFGPETPAAPPGDDLLDALRMRVGSGLLVLDGAGVRKLRPDVYCDLSAVAKGYAVDRVAAALDAAGLARYMVEVGGEIRVRGTNAAGTPWRLGVEKPDATGRAVQEVVPLTGLAMATSGDYRNYAELGGRRLSHLIDPRTGRPVEHNLASVTVLHEECAWADAYATALMVLGPEEGMALAERLGLAVYMLVRDGEDFREIGSTAFSAYLGEMGRLHPAR